MVGKMKCLTSMNAERQKDVSILQPGAREAGSHKYWIQKRNETKLPIDN